MLACGACKSENIQKLSLVYEGGLSHAEGKETGIGVGLGAGGVGTGIGSSKYKGTNQSLLSKNAAPPVKRKPVKEGFFYLLGVVLVYQFAPGNLGIEFLLIVAGGIHVFWNWRYNQNTFPGLIRQWNASFLCLKCGTISLPMQEQSPTTPA
jgi:hypothetical protein